MDQNGQPMEAAEQRLTGHTHHSGLTSKNLESMAAYLKPKILIKNALLPIIGGIQMNIRD